MTNPAHNPEELLAHAVWIRNLARRLVGEGHADDLVQDTWEAALRAQPDRLSSLKPWLGRVLRNFARQAGRRRQARGRAQELSEPLSADASPEVLLARGETQAHLVQAVLGLREPFRSTVILRFYEGQSPQQIAQRLGVPAATVRGRLKRAIDELRLRLDETHGGDRQMWIMACMPLAAGKTQATSVLVAQHSGLNWSLAAGVVGLLLFGGLWSSGLLGTPSEPGGSMVVPRALPVAQGIPERAPARSVPAAATQRVAAGATTATSPPEVHAPWSGRLVDSETAEPVPHFQFHVKQAGREESLQTDERGQFQGKAPMDGGAYKLWAADGPNTFRMASVHNWGRGEPTRIKDWREQEYDRSQPSRDIPVAVGPTYSLVIEGAPHLKVQDFEALLLPRGLPQGVYQEECYGIDVRSGALPWVRFPPLPKAFSKRPSWNLTLLSRDGLWLGAAQVRSIRGINSQPLVIALERRARIEGSVRERSAGAISGASIQLDLLAAAPAAQASFGDGPMSPESRVTNDSGNFVFPRLAPGRYRLRCDSPGHDPEEHFMEVSPGDTEKHVFTLNPRPLSGAIEGQLTSASGEYTSHVVVRVQPIGSAARSSTPEVEWSREKQKQRGTFKTGDLPAGTYEVSVCSLIDNYSWGAKQRVQVPASAVNFEVDDLAPTVDLEFRVLDAETGDRIEPFQHGVMIDAGRTTVLMDVVGGSAHVLRVPLNANLQWAVHADGYATRYGNLGDFQPGKEGVAVAEVLLDRGWRARLFVRHRGSVEPTVGATVFAEGRVVGETNNAGTLLVELPKAPTVLEVRHGDLSGRRSRFPEAQPQYLIELSPAPGNPPTAPSDSE